MTSNQPNYAEDAENFANEPPLQLTLRVMHAIYSNPRFWVGMAAVIMVLTIMGPFNTLRDMSFAPRLVYWGGISLLTFPVGMAVSICCAVWLYQRGVPEALSRLLGGAIGGLPLGGIVFIANAWIAQTTENTLTDLVRMTVYTVPISSAISIIYYLIESTMRSQVENAAQSLSTTPKLHPNTAVEPAPTAAFFARLPRELGKDIISLQAQDHYVKVTTPRGNEMILIRLSDAEKELAGVPGLRVHRSWWVSVRHAERLVRQNHKLLLELSNGDLIPVSRSYAANVRNAIENK